MGSFRLLLALAVVISHSAPIAGFPLISGGLAVKVFFMVSGFYMALILSEKYQPLPRGLWLFFSNRFLRIFPLFWLVLFLEILLGWLAPQFATNPSATSLHQSLLHTSGPAVLATLGLSELTLLGSEWFSLLAWIPEQGLQWHTSTTPADALRGWQLTVMPHTWTLGCEIAFYLAAPWLNRCRSLWLILILAVNIALILCLPCLIDPRLAEAAIDYSAPLQFGFFIAGMLAWRSCQSWSNAFKKKAALLLIGLLFTFLFGFDRLSQFTSSGALLGLFTTAAVSIPALFLASRDLHWDRFIGDLSYPVYLCHPLAIRFLHEFGPSFFPDSDWTQSSAFALSAILLSCALAWLLSQAVDRPLNQIRQRRVGPTDHSP